jgi:hypothetical protein
VQALGVQPASDTTLHCFVDGGAPFELSTPAKVLAMEGVRGAHLVTAGRLPERWCLVLETELTVARENAERLEELARTWARLLGLKQIRLLRPVERRDSGPASDINDWLKW